MTEKMAKRRVKLYTLNAERQWDDRGTGHVTSTYVERLKGMSLLVKAENDGALLLESKILPDTAYQRQQGTLIVWSEGESYDLALSFQEKAGCEEIWEKICQVQGKDPSLNITQELVEESEDDRYDDTVENVEVELPACEVANLEEINETIGNCIASQVRREKLAGVLESEGYIKKLINIFHICEDLGNIEGLHQLYEIFKQIFHLNKNTLFELMFSEDMVFHVVGALEYDPSCAYPKRHRQYLKGVAKFRDVIPIDNKELLSKIHQTYRVQYIQDVVLPTPQVFEENILSTLSSFIFFNKVEIVNMLQDDEKLLTDLFTTLSKEEDDLPIEKRRELFLFLKEFCTFSQTLQPISRENFFKTLSTLGILPAVEVSLCIEDAVTKAATIDVLTFIVEFSPSIVREYMLLQQNRVDEEQFLINIIIEQMVLDMDPEMGGAAQLNGILRILIDPENMLSATAKSERTDFLTFIYKHSMHFLVAPLLSNTAGDEVCKKDYQTAQLLALILELLTFCVEHHMYHIKYYIVQRELLKRTLVLLKSKHTFLVLCALRFMRKIIGLKDDFYNRHIINGRLFGPIIEAFERNNGRYNLLDSAIIEVFEYIKSEKLRSLCANVIDNYESILSKVEYVQTFRNLRKLYDGQDTPEKKDKGIEGGVGGVVIRGSNGPVSIVGEFDEDDVSRIRRQPKDVESDEEVWLTSQDDITMDELDHDEFPGTNEHTTPSVSFEESVRLMREIPMDIEIPEPKNTIDIANKLPCVETSGSDSLPATEFSLNLLQNDSAFNVSKENHLNCNSNEPRENSKSPVPVDTENVKSPILTTKKVSLVDYDENSDEEEDEAMDEGSKEMDDIELEPPNKRLRVDTD